MIKKKKKAKMMQKIKKKNEKKSEKSNETIKKSNTVDHSKKKAKNTYSEKQIKLIKKLELPLITIYIGKK